MSLKQLYEYHRDTPSDINENMHHLYEYAQYCETIIEMGTRMGSSIFAFAYAKPKKLTSMDIDIFPHSEELKKLCTAEGIEYEHIVGSTLELDIPEVDMLFIDTEHSYLQLKSELAKHGNKAKMYLVFHDTTTFGYVDSSAYGDQGLKYEDGTDVKHGLMPALEEFLEANPHWVIDLVKTNNNGMTFLKRID